MTIQLKNDLVQVHIYHIERALNYVNQLHTIMILQK